ncbi:DUF7344 domain-containing protein [Haloarchaeobius iranensis]|uniref:DUF7344 domain-containing protein n=1 Tax=Haloarchaeobius iranensis TaxID=996166 RepID=A0A1G9YHR7_9EURY|nr:hypothetical protein [Haloarchaeobius iranensis]SDN08003.1 hypothetical protein SAMN05192554_11451 [Haloarchaeobius iranensis]
MFNTDTLSEETIYEILANSRRRETIRHLTVESTGEAMTLHELSQEIAARETGESPPPRPARESVYNSLHQTHLPKLEELGVVDYDRDAREVNPSDHARDVDKYMEVVTSHGVTWSEVYRSLGVASLTLVLWSLVDFPVVSAVDPMLWTSGSLAVFALLVTYQLWSNRWYIRQSLQG